MTEVWWEKYRPKNLEQIVGQDHLISEFGNIIGGSSVMQHYLFHSKGAGTGKTSMAHVLANMLDYNIHTFNASSKRQRGIEFIEEDIIPLSRLGMKQTIFFLDEADRLTPQAQDALKGVIEDASGYFILTCNDINKVSPYLKSRCQVREFKLIDEDEMYEHLKAISIREDGAFEDAHLKIICEKHKGDLRNAIGALQAYCTTSDREQFIRELSDKDVNVNRILKLCFKEKAHDLAVKEFSDSIRNDIHSVFRYAVENKGQQANKMKVIEAAIISERDILNGVNEEIVLHNFIRMLAK